MALLGLATGAIPHPARAQAQGARGANYPLGPGDVLSLTVAGFPEYSQSSILVPPDGVVSLPRYGTIRLSGRTTLSVQNELRGILTNRIRMRNPSVALSITTFRPPRPTIVGQVILAGDVPRPGSFGIKAKERLSTLLAEAGLSERLEEKRATLVRGNSSFSLNLSGAAYAPGSPSDIALRPGDSIAVSAVASGKITVSGEVARPGTYELHRAPRGDFEIGPSPRLSDLLTRAGWQRGGLGPAAKSAGSASDVSASTGASGSGAPQWTGTLQRGGQTLVIHPDLALARVGGPSDIALRAGDFVSIAQVPPIKVIVDGLVARPNSYLLAPRTGVLELLTEAGGPTAATGDIIAGVRRGAQVLPIDMNALFNGSPGADLQLQDGDYVQLRAPETLEVPIAGQVAKPGTVQVKPGAAVFEAVNQAGGIVGNAEDVRLSVLRKEADGSQRILEVDAPKVLGAVDMTTNYPLQRGDVINVARRIAQTVFVTGEVGAPGSFSVRSGEGLTQLLTRAGGVKDDAYLSKVGVTRGTQVLQVDAYDAVRKGVPLDFTLQEGDQVLVQKNPNVVKVVGSVTKPDTYFIPERGQLTLSDVLSQAAPVSGVKQVFVVHARPDGTFDTTNAPAINLLDLYRGKTPNILLHPYDVVFVPPPKGPKRGLLDTLGQISVLRFFF